MQANWICSQLGAREHYAVPRSLERLGMLDTLFTDAWCRHGRFLFGRGGRAMRGFANRHHPELPPGKVVSFNSQLFMRQGRGAVLGNGSCSEYDGHIEIGTWFARAVRQQLERRQLDPARHVFFGFNTGCLETLEWLQPRGIFSIVDQIDPARVEYDLVARERKKWPGWEADGGGVPERYFQRLAREWELASVVLVNSAWSQQALVQQGVPAEKIITLPLAYEADGLPAIHRPRREGPLQVLWVGSVILRKGIQYLIAAARQLPEAGVQFTVAGPIGISREAVAGAPANMKFLGPVSRNAVTALYQAADVYVLPTLSDGFALTQLEAMAHGLPVISTPNCGEVVTHGRDGFIVPAGDPGTLAQAIHQLIQDRQALQEMQKSAFARSQQFRVEDYGAKLLHDCQKFRTSKDIPPGNSKLSPRKYVVTQLGARQHYAVPRSLERLGMLDTLFTDAWCRHGRFLFGRGGRAMRGFANRHHPELPPGKVVSFNSQLFMRQGRGAVLGNGSCSEYDGHIEIGTWFARAVRQQLERRQLDPARHVFFGFNTGCLETLEWLQPRGIFSIVDQIDPARVEYDLVARERKKWPGWEADGGGVPERYFQRLAREWELASVVLVNSAWSQQALVQQGVPAEKIITLPLAYEADGLPAIHRPRREGPLQVLWVGSVILRKGIQYLIAAARQLPEAGVQFTVAGPIGISREAVAGAPANMKFLGPVSRNAVTALYQAADVYVLPTLSDGFALTQLEAMAHGLPVISTPNCGEVVTHGRDGFIVPAGDPDTLAQAIHQLIQDRQLLKEMTARTSDKIMAYSVSSYGRRLVAEVENKLGLAADSNAADHQQAVVWSKVLRKNV